MLSIAHFILQNLQFTHLAYTKFQQDLGLCENIMDQMFGKLILPLNFLQTLIRNDFNLP